MQDNKKFKLVSVLLSGPFDKVFSYKINISSYEVGKIIIAPFRNQKLLGIILDEDPDLIDDEKVKAEEWVGVIDLSFGDSVILYGKIDEPDGIYETLELTNVEYQDYLIKGDILEITN